MIGDCCDLQEKTVRVLSALSRVLQSQLVEQEGPPEPVPISKLIPRFC